MKSKPFQDLGLPPLDCKCKIKVWEKKMARVPPFAKSTNHTPPCDTQKQVITRKTYHTERLWDIYTFWQNRPLKAPSKSVKAFFLEIFF